MEPCPVCERMAEECRRQTLRAESFKRKLAASEERAHRAIGLAHEADALNAKLRGLLSGREV